MSYKIFLYAFISIAVSAALRSLFKATGTKISTDRAGEYHLRMNILYGIIGIGSIILGLTFIIWPLTEDTIDSATITITALMLAMFCGLGTPCWLYYRNHRMTFDSEIIRVTNVYGKTAEIKWHDIESMRFNAFSGLLAIQDNKGNKIKVHQHLVGLSTFMGMVESKTSWTSKKLRIPINSKNSE
jgi:hypothetical protein